MINHENRTMCPLRIFNVRFVPFAVQGAGDHLGKTGLFECEPQQGGEAGDEGQGLENHRMGLMVWWFNDV